MTSFGHSKGDILVSAPSNRRHVFGDVLPEGLDKASILKHCDLDWRVEMHPEYVDVDDTLFATGKYSAIRGDNNTLLGTGLSHTYNPVQNDEMLDFMEALHEDGQDVNYLCAGKFGNGETLWALADSPKIVEPVPGDPTKLNLMLVNSHNGSGAFKALLTPVRLACNNAFRLAISKRRSSISIRHSRGTLSTRLKEAKVVLGFAHKAFDEFGQLAQLWAKVQMNSKKLQSFVEAVEPFPDLKESGEYPRTAYLNTLVRQDRLKELFESGTGQDIKGVSGTGWAAFNAATEYYNYEAGNNQDRRYENVVLGNSKASGAVRINTAYNWLTTEAFA